MKDVLEAGAKVLKDLLNVEISQDLMPYVVVASTLGPWLIWVYFSIRRWRGDFKAISGELEAATKVISHDTKREFDSVLSKFSTIEESLRSTIDSRFATLHAALVSTTQVESAADDEIEKEAVSAPQSTKTRLGLAEQVRNTVVDKWLTGRTFRKDEKEANCYWFEGIADAGSKIEILLQTPYRSQIGTDGRLPYTLEVWVKGYKKLNFEWDIEGNYALRGFKKGDWIEDVALWHFGGAQELSQGQAAA